MVRQGFRLCLYSLGKPLFQRIGNGGMQLRAAAFQKPVIRDIPHQCVLESINRVRDFATPKDQL